MGKYAGGGGGSTAIFTRFTASGTWTKGADTTGVRVEVIGAGGGGGGGISGAAGTARNGGGGGGGGAIAMATYDAADLGATETITIGEGGAGGGVATDGGSGGGPPLRFPPLPLGGRVCLCLLPCLF